MRLQSEGSLEPRASYDNSQSFPATAPPEPSLTQLIPGFLRYGEIERSLSKATIAKYGECLDWIVRDLGDVPATSITTGSVTLLKQRIMIRGGGEARVASMVFALRSFLRYTSEELGLAVLPPVKVRPPKRRRREVLFLSPEEIEQFVSSIKIEALGARSQSRPQLDGLRFRTLVEVLLGTGMRISEALSLDRDSINFEKKEAKIVGKGSKERTIFFSDRALWWIHRYLDARRDEEPALFLTQRGTRLSTVDVSSLFRRYCRKAGVRKRITPRILRHTTATTLLFNGCPISHVKEILGHDLLETTCKYYLGVDKSRAKEAHKAFLTF